MWDKIKLVFAIIGAAAVCFLLFVFHKRTAGDVGGTGDRVRDDIDSVGEGIGTVSDSVDSIGKYTERAREAQQRGDTAVDAATQRLRDLIHRLREEGIAKDPPG